MRLREQVPPLGLFLLGCLVAWQPLADIDWPLHVAMGRRILAEGALPFRDAFSWTLQGGRDTPHEWLFQLLWAALDRMAGPRALQLAMVLFAGAGALLWFRAARGLRSQAGAATVALLALLLFLPRFRARPDLATWIALPLLAGTLARPWPAPPARLVRVFLGTALWANLHGAALMAPLLLGVAAVGSRLGRREEPRTGFRLAMAALLGTLLTPQGPRLLAYARETAGLGDLIPEWGNLAQVPGEPLFQAIQAAVLLAAVSLAGFVLLALARRRIPPRLDLLAAAGVGIGAAFAAHRFAVLGALSALWLPLPPRARRAAAPGILLLALLLLLLWVPRAGTTVLRPGRYPVEAADFLARADLPRGARLFHEPGFGGYLIYRLWPRFLVAVDGRVTTYGARLARQVLELARGDLGREELQDWLEKGKVEAVVMGTERGEALLLPGRWRLAYRGRGASVWLARSSS